MEADITFCQVVASCSLDRTVERVELRRRRPAARTRSASPTHGRPYASASPTDARPSVRVRGVRADHACRATPSFSEPFGGLGTAQSARPID